MDLNCNQGHKIFLHSAVDHLKNKKGMLIQLTYIMHKEKTALIYDLTVDVDE